MITRDKELGPRGDCIVGVAASKGVADLEGEFKSKLRLGREVKITLRAGGAEEVIHARGHGDLPLTHPSDLVVRKSGFLCGRTLAIRADKAAGDLSREFVARLRNPRAKIQVLLEVT